MTQEDKQLLLKTMEEFREFRGYLHGNLLYTFPLHWIDNIKVKNGVMIVSYYDDDEVGIIHPVHDIRVKADTFVDACYELVLKLHEQKVL